MIEKIASWTTKLPKIWRFWQNSSSQSQGILDFDCGTISICQAEDNFFGDGPGSANWRSRIKHLIWDNTRTSSERAVNSQPSAISPELVFSFILGNVNTCETMNRS